MVFAELMQSLVAGKRGRSGWESWPLFRVPTNSVAAAACPAVSQTRIAAVEETARQAIAATALALSRMTRYPRRAQPLVSTWGTNSPTQSPRRLGTSLAEACLC